MSCCRRLPRNAIPFRPPGESQAGLKAGSPPGMAAPRVQNALPDGRASLAAPNICSVKPIPNYALPDSRASLAAPNICSVKPIPNYALPDGRASLAAPNICSIKPIPNYALPDGCASLAAPNICSIKPIPNYALPDGRASWRPRTYARSSRFRQGSGARVEIINRCVGRTRLLAFLGRIAATGRSLPTLRRNALYARDASHYAVALVIRRRQQEPRD